MIDVIVIKMCNVSKYKLLVVYCYIVKFRLFNKGYIIYCSLFILICLIWYYLIENIWFVVRM